MHPIRLSLASLAILLLTSGCTHSVHAVYVSSFEPFTPRAQGRWIASEAEDKIILGFAFQTDYVELAKSRLQEQCKGDIVGISTEFMTSHGFFSWTSRVYMKGLCTSKAR